MTVVVESGLRVRLARDDRDLEAAQRLRYQVFVEELGASGKTVDHARRLELDNFDEVFEHLLLIDEARTARGLDHVVGAYRLLTSDRMARMGCYYSHDEFDLDPLIASGRRLMELGRSCVHPDYRGGASMLLMWNGIYEFVLDRGIEVMFGAASFHGTDPAVYAQALSFLYHNHLAPPSLRLRAKPPGRQEMALLPPSSLVRGTAMGQVPALIRGYLRLGGFIGDGAYIDRDFNTIDVCLVVDTAIMSARHRSFYVRRQGRET